MRDILQDLVQQGHKTSARLDKLEEELAMKSASSGHSGDLAFHESKFHGRGVGSVGAEDRDGGIPGVLVPSVRRFAGESTQRGCMAKNPSEMPVGGTSCQHFYTSGEGHGALKALGLPGGRGQGVTPRMNESELLGRILRMPDDELRDVKKHFENRALSEEATKQAGEEYFMRRDGAAPRTLSGGSSGGRNSLEAPTLVGGGFRSAPQLEHVHVSAALQASPLQDPAVTGGFQDQGVGKLDHARNRGGDASHMHSAAVGCQQGSPLHSGSLGSLGGSFGNGLVPEGRSGLPGLFHRGAVDRAVGLDSHDSALNAGHRVPVRPQFPVVDVPNMRACADSPCLHEQYMSACAASVPSSSCSPLDALSPGNLGVWSAGDALHGQSVAPQLTTTDYPRSVASPTLSEHGNGGGGAPRAGCLQPRG